jgi:hypothetical protein
MSSILGDFCSKELNIEDIVKLDPVEFRRRNRDRFISKFKKEDPADTQRRINELYKNVQEKFNKMLEAKIPPTKDQKKIYCHNLLTLERAKLEFPVERPFEVVEEEISSEEIAEEFVLIPKNPGEKAGSIFCKAAIEELSDPEIKGFRSCVPFAFIEAAQAANPEKNIYYARCKQVEDNLTLITDMQRLKAELDEERVSEGVIFIPMGLKGQGPSGLLRGTFSEDHATLITVKFSEKWKEVRIEYYDPKKHGNPKNHMCVYGENLQDTLDKASEIFRTASGEKVNVEISSIKDQSRLNKTHCALHVLHHMTRWIENDMFLKETIENTKVRALALISTHLTQAKEEKKPGQQQVSEIQIGLESWGLIHDNEIQSSSSDESF